MIEQKQGPGRPRSANRLSAAEKQARYRDRLQRKFSAAWDAQLAAERDAEAAETAADRAADRVDEFDRDHLEPAIKASASGVHQGNLAELFAEHKRLFAIYREALVRRNALYKSKHGAWKVSAKAESALLRVA